MYTEEQGDMGERKGHISVIRCVEWLQSVSQFNASPKSLLLVWISVGLGGYIITSDDCTKGWDITFIKDLVQRITWWRRAFNFKKLPGVCTWN